MTLRERIEDLKGIEAPSVHHPESNQWFHTMQVTLHALDELRPETSPTTESATIIMAAALHDIGKAIVFPLQGDTKKHEGVSADLVRAAVGSNIVRPENTAYGMVWWEDVIWLIENHLRIMWYLDGQMTHSKGRELSNHVLFKPLCQLRRFDIKGRDPNFLLTWRNIARFEKVLDNLGL